MVRVLLSVALFSLSIQAQTSHAKEKLIATPMNSPVKETYLKVRLEGFDLVSEVFFKPKNGGSEVSGEIVKEGNAFIGKFKGSFLKPGKYQYRVKVRTVSGKTEKDEAASIAFIDFEIDSSLGVADPGEEGKKTLLGIDTDNDGVRDDVQRWINEAFAGKESTKEALKQMSRTMKNRFLNVDSKEGSIVASHEFTYAISCLNWIDIDSGSDKSTALSKIYNNTASRIQASLASDANFHGQGVGPRRENLKSSEWNQLCDFVPQKNN